MLSIQQHKLYKMRKIATILFTTVAFTSFAQVGRYTFTKETGQPWEIDQYPNIAVTDHVVNDDSVWPYKIKIPFPFKFNGQVMDSVGIAENGFIWFGTATENEVASVTTPISGTFPSTVTGIISAMGADLHPHVNTSLTTLLRSGLTGTAPMRELIIEWKNTSRIEPIMGGRALDTITFQIKLYEFMNRIEVAYIKTGLNPFYNTLTQVGLRGKKGDDYNIRSTETTGTNWRNTTEGTKSDATCELSATHYPNFGDMFVWMDLNTDPTSVDELNHAGMRLYPNPATDKIEVSTGISEATTLCIMDINGKVIHQQVFSSNTVLNTQDWNRGIYLIQLKDKNNRVQTKKLVLQ